MKRILFLFIVLIVGFTILNGQGKTTKDRNSRVNRKNPSAWTYSLKMDVLNLYVSNDGFFTLERKDEKLLLFWGNEPWFTSHTNIKINSTLFNNSLDNIRDYGPILYGTVTVVPKTKIVIDYGVVFSNVRVKQEFIPIEDVAKNSGSLYIKTIFINQSATATKTVGALLHLDIDIDNNDHAPIFMNGKIQDTAKIINPIPDIWLAYSDYGNPDALIGRGQTRGNINGMPIIPPDYLFVGDWRWSQNYGYDENDGNPDDIGYLYGDSQLLLRWNQVSLKPKDTVFFSTLYGVTEPEYTTGSKLMVDCQVPSENISLDSVNNYTPNPFDFMVNIKNISTGNLTNVKAKIEYDANIFQLNPVTESSTKFLNPSTISEDELGSLKWSFSIKNQSQARSSQIKVTVSADQILSSDQTNSCIKTINIPSKTPTSSCSLTANVNGSGTITGNTGTQSYPCATPVKLVATANSCYTFTGWTGDIGSNNAMSDSIDITVNGNLNVTANFSKIKYPLTTNIVGGGTISGNTGSPYNCDTTVYLTATPAACYRFKDWTGNVPINFLSFPSVDIKMDKAKNVTANFEKIKYTFNASSYENGSILVNGSPYINSLQFNCGDTVKLRAIPNACYGFDKWWDDSKTDSTIIIINSDMTISAVFSTLPMPGLTVKTNPTGGGVVIDSSGTEYQTFKPYNCGALVKLKAAPNSCYRFTGWTGDYTPNLSSDSIISLTMDKNKTVTANFEKIKYSLTVTPGANGKIHVNDTAFSGIRTFDCGSIVKLKAVPEDCYGFSSWGDNAKNDTMTIIMNKDIAVSATFVKSQQILSIKINPPAAGKVNDNSGNEMPAQKTYNCGESVIIKAVENQCYRFVNWTDENGRPFDTSASTNFNLYTSKTLTANFEKNNFILHTAIDPVGYGTISGNDYRSYACGTKVTLTAKANGCNEFLGWVGDITASFDTITIDMIKDWSITAKFRELKYSLTTNVIGSGTISGNTKSSYTCDTVVNLTASPVSCYKFTGWTGAVVSNIPTISIKMDKAKSVTANFEKIKYALLTSVSPSGSGTITGNTGAQQYDCDRAVSLEAKADPCYTFLYWSDDTTNSNAIRTVKMDIDRSIQAIFKIKQYSFTTSIDINGSGIITKEPEKTLYNCGEKVRLTLSSEPCYSFVCWNNNPGLSLSSFEVIIDDNKTYIAQMAKIDLNYYGVNTSNLPNIILNFRVDSITKNQSYPMSSLQKNLLVISDSGCGNAIIGNYNLITKNDPYKIVYDFDNKCFSKPCDTSRYATIIFRRNDCEIRKTLTYSVPLNLGCDSCGRIVIRTDTIPKQTINMLFNNMPNPFNPETRIRYNISEAGMVTMAVYDLLGREISVLVNEFQDVGEYEVSFIPRNLPGGVYFYIIKTKNYTSVKKMVYVK